MSESDQSQEQLRSALDPEFVESLERHKGAEVSQGRMHARVEANLKVVVRPGNSSESKRLRLQGVTADLSCGGCRLILPLPVGVGDVFRIEIEYGPKRIPMVFARCLRCRLVREDVFEAGFSFFAQLELPESLAPTDGLG